jgi:integrase/recombinase XerD
MKLKNIAVLELLFSTGLRVSELCSIKSSDIDLKIGFVKVWGKGAKERIVFISNQETLSSLRKYKTGFSEQIESTGWFFVNRLGRKLTEQSVRDTIKLHAKLAKISEHITPHMLRHSFATLMLEEDVDIRYIQSILGHSSISTTQIYTYVSLNKQKNIMKKKHPRNRISI